MKIVMRTKNIPLRDVRPGQSFTYLGERYHRPAREEVSGTPQVVVRALDRDYITSLPPDTMVMAWVEERVPETVQELIDSTRSPWDLANRRLRVRGVWGEYDARFVLVEPYRGTGTPLRLINEASGNHITTPTDFNTLTITEDLSS